MSNRQQRRAQARSARKKGNGRSRYTPPLTARVTYLDGDGNVVRTETVAAEPVPAPPSSDQAEQAERQRRLASAVAHGLWVPGLPV